MLTFNDSQFSWDQCSHTFLNEASTLQITPDTNMHEPIEFIIERGNVKTTCMHSETQKNEDGDVIAWLYSPYESDAEFTLKILND